MNRCGFQIKGEQLQYWGDGREVGSFSHYLQGCSLHPRWLFGIYSINSITSQKSHKYGSPPSLLPNFPWRRLPGKTTSSPMDGFQSIVIIIISNSQSSDFIFNCVKVLNTQKYFPFWFDTKSKLGQVESFDQKVSFSDGFFIPVVRKLFP